MGAGFFAADFLKLIEKYNIVTIMNDPVIKIQ
jgi:hypothetical protein